MADTRGDDVAVLLMNYGGPEGPEDCEPYLRNIFLDPDLIPIPGLIRPLVARLAGRRRAPQLQKNYEAMGRYTPTLQETMDQARALENALGERFRCYVGMRYWKPFIREACDAMTSAGFRHIVLLPLYPHESRTTTGSSISEARRCLRSLKWSGQVSEIRSFWDAPGYLDALAEKVAGAIRGAPDGTRVLFTAHGLPLSVARKDPYPSQVARTVLQISARAGVACREITIAGLDQGPFRTDASEETLGGISGTLAWQSKVGPMRWLEPSVETVMGAWKIEGVRRLVVVPVAFVNEHSETLYELDVLYGDMAREMGMEFVRVPTLQVHPAFIEALAGLVREAAE